jgi:phosphate transport system substrate-binding protein
MGLFESFYCLEEGEGKTRLSMINMRFGIIVSMVLLVAALAGCYREREETPTKGRLTVMVSESVAPLLAAEKAKFEELYPNTSVELIVTSARDAIVNLINDSVRVIVSSRRWNTKEQQVVQREKIDIHEYKIALDGIAVIVNNQNPISHLRTTQLDSVWRGLTTRWRDLGWNQSPASIESYIPDRNAGAYEVLQHRVLNGNDFASPAGFLNSSQEMVTMVERNTSAIGLVGLNWLHTAKDQVKPLQLLDPHLPDTSSIKGQYVGPYQAYVYQGYYPLIREIYIYARSDPYGVASGFISFVMSAPGQQIVLNNGLVPATMPVRIVELSNRGIDQ